MLAPDREFTGFVLAGDCLEGCDEWTRAYGFEGLVTVMRDLSSLLDEAGLCRRGEDDDDKEGHYFDGSRWFVEIHREFLVPADRVEQAERILDHTLESLSRIAGDTTESPPDLGVYLVRRDTTHLYGTYFVEAVGKVKNTLTGEERIFLDEERIQVFRLADEARTPPAHGVNHPPGREVFGVVIGQDMP